MLHLINFLPINIITDFARGGGGGSGGGGGGSGGGGDGLVLIVLLGYLPTHFVGALMRRKLRNPIGFVITLITTLVVFALFAGSTRLSGLMALAAIGALVGGPAGFFGWFGKISARVRKKASKDIAKAAQNDPAWDIEKLNAHVQQTFMQFQNDWSTFNVDSIQTYLTTRYSTHIQLMLGAIKLRQRRNQVDNPQILEMYPVEVDDFDGNTADSVTYYINGKADDILIESIDGEEKRLFEDKNQFYEYWRFVRSGNTWLLDGISQLTEQKAMLRKDIQDFASANGLYYSADWGWLLLPRRGDLFKGSQFGVSDINNHAIGLYHNLLIELYSYRSATQKDTTPVQTLVAQTALPKRYDSIVVKAKGSGSWLTRAFGGDKAPKGYNKIELEWPDFNKRYNVYATNVEQVTAFELLHPVYMEKLFALPFKVNIEVVDNVVYLYSKDKLADYQTMYNLLMDAFKEMRL